MMTSRENDLYLIILLVSGGGGGGGMVHRSQLVEREKTKDSGTRLKDSTACST